MEDIHARAFRALRPPCVELSNVALKLKTQKATGKHAIEALEKLRSTLLQVSRTPHALNSKLADYVFFPLSHIFRDVKQSPTRATEVAVQCLDILLREGWKAQLAPEMGKQLLILLCFVVGGSPTESKVKDVQEDLGTAVFGCLSTLCAVSPDIGLAEGTKIKSENIPTLGHTVLVFLDGILEGPSAGVRSAALTALQNLLKGISDLVALRNVLPGLVSALTKMLSSKTTAKPSSKLLIIGMNTMDLLLCKVIGDSLVIDCDPSSQTELSKSDVEEKKKDAWLEATTAQIAMALSNIFPLRSHRNVDVRSAVLRLCLSLMERCRNSLEQSVPKALETAVVIFSHPTDQYGSDISALEQLLAKDSTLVEMLRSSLRDWIISLPRNLQSHDESQRQNMIERVSASYRLLAYQVPNFDMLNDTLARSLRESLAESARAEATKAISTVATNDLAISTVLGQARLSAESPGFEPILLNRSSDRSTLLGLESFLDQVKKLPMSHDLQQDFARNLRISAGNEQLASLWLSIHFLKLSASESELLDEFVDLSMESSQNLFLDDIYSFALDVLSKSTFEDEERWQLQALSLEVVSLQAREQKEDFRPELVDALYPILERLGSSNPNLQSHAITCLSIVSQACKYSDPAALIVDNADYLINSISLKLNTFSISPQAPQVLVMIIRLCGAPLIPYLDDVVESIFSILGCYHGYPKLVESLFSVLSAIVSEASKAAPRMIEDSSDGISKARHYTPMSMPELLAQLRTLDNPSSEPDPSRLDTSEPPENQENQPPPSTYPDSPDPTQSLSPPSEPPSPPKSKTLTLLENITSLTPAHLTTPSPSLRASLMHLLNNSLPAIAASDADTFLPLSATLFPLLSTRLFAAEETAPVLLATARVMTTLCTSSGDFLSSRVGEDMWWAKFKSLLAKTEMAAREEVRIWTRGRVGMPNTAFSSSSSSSLQVGPRAGKTTTNTAATVSSDRHTLPLTSSLTRRRYTGPWTETWQALLTLLLTIARDVGVDAEKEDDVFAMLTPLITATKGHAPATTGGISSRKLAASTTSSTGGASAGWGWMDLVLTREDKSEIRSVLELVNADALWLCEERARVNVEGGEAMKTPAAVGGLVFRDLEL